MFHWARWDPLILWQSRITLGDAENTNNLISEQAKKSMRKYP